MKAVLLIAIAVVVIISDTVEAQASGGISWCEYARLVGRDMTGCNNGKVGGIIPPLNTISSDPGAIAACTSNIICPAKTTCIRGQCVPLVGVPATEPQVSILPAPVDACAAMLCIATTVCRNGKCEPISNGSGSASCPANEEYVTCSTCETSCGKPTLACPMMCGPPKCECVAAKGFARDGNGRCIPRLQCPVNSNSGRACAATTCPVGQYCIEQQVQCFVPPCNPIAICVRAISG